MIFKEDISIFHDLVHSWILFYSGSFELVRKEPAATISSTRPELRFYWLWTWPLERPPEGNFMWWQTNPQIESSQNLALKVAETMLRSTRYHMPGKFRLGARCWRRCYHVLQVEAVLDILGILQLLQDFLLQISLTRRAVVKHQTSTCWSAFVQQVDFFLCCGLQETGEVHGGIRRHLDGPKLGLDIGTSRHSPLRHFTCAIATTIAIILPGVFLANTTTWSWLVHRKHHAEIAYDARIGGWFYCACPIAQYFGDFQQAQNSWRPELVWEISSRGGRKFYGEAPVAFLDLELSQESSTMTWETFRKPKIPLYTQFQLSS